MFLIKEESQGEEEGGEGGNYQGAGMDTWPMRMHSYYKIKRYRGVGVLRVRREPWNSKSEQCQIHTLTRSFDRDLLSFAPPPLLHLLDIL